MAITESREGAPAPQARSSLPTFPLFLYRNAKWDISPTPMARPTITDKTDERMADRKNKKHEKGKEKENKKIAHDTNKNWVK